MGYFPCEWCDKHPHNVSIVCTGWWHSKPHPRRAVTPDAPPIVWGFARVLGRRLTRRSRP